MYTSPLLFSNKNAFQMYHMYTHTLSTRRPFTGVFRRARTHGRFDGLRLSSLNPDNSRTRPARRVALHTKTHPRRTHAKHHAGTSVTPETRSNAIDECATRCIDRRVRSNTRDECTTDGWMDGWMADPLLKPLFFETPSARRRSAHRAIGGGREVDDRGSSDRSRSAYSSFGSRSASSAGGEEGPLNVKKGSIGINPIAA